MKKNYEKESLENAKKELAQAIRDNIADKRMKKNLSQQAVADAIGISYQAYQKYEDSKKPSLPNLLNLKKLSEFYNVSLDELVSKESNEIEQLKGMLLSYPDDLRSQIINHILELVRLFKNN